MACTIAYMRRDLFMCLDSTSSGSQQYTRVHSIVFGQSGIYNILQTYMTNVHSTLFDYLHFKFAHNAKFLADSAYDSTDVPIADGVWNNR